MKRLLLKCCSCLLLPGIAAAQDADVAVPPARPLEVPPRIGIEGEARMGLREVIQRVLQNDPDIETSRIVREQALLNVKAAKGAFDPVAGMTASRLRSVAPVASALSGSADGKLGTEQYVADPSVSGLFPALGGNYRLDFSSARQTSDSSFLSLNPQYPTAISLSLTQPLWRGLLFDDNRHRLAAARKNVLLSDAQFEQQVIAVVTAAVQAYWELEYAYRNLAVQIEAVHLAEEQDASNRRQVAQGLLAPIDVVAAQTQVATFQQNVYTAQSALTTAENALKALMLADRGDILWGMALVPEDLPAPGAPLPDLGEAVRIALAGRPELAENAIATEVNSLDARLSREQTKPQVDAVGSFSTVGLSGHTFVAGPNPLTASFLPFINGIDALNSLNGLPPVLFGPAATLPPQLIGGYSQSLSALTRGNFTTLQAGIQVSVPIRNRTAQAQLAVALAEGKRLRNARRQTEMAVEQDVRNALQAAHSADARLAAAAAAREYAEQQYSSEERQFQAGTSTVFLVLQRQTDLIAARTREVRAHADVGEARAALDRALARTIEVQDIQLELNK